MGKRIATYKSRSDKTDRRRENKVSLPCEPWEVPIDHQAPTALSLGMSPRRIIRKNSSDAVICRDPQCGRHLNWANKSGVCVGHRHGSYCGCPHCLSNVHGRADFIEGLTR